MLKHRIIPIELFDGQRLIKTLGFEGARHVGDPVKSSMVYSDQDADELLFLNVHRENPSIAATAEVVRRIASVCFVPLTVGGGVRSAADAETLFRAGADKIVVNSVAYRAPSVVRTISETMGRQAVVIAIDVRRQADGSYLLLSGCGRTPEAVSLVEHLETVTSHGAGEIFLQAVDRDGTMAGYDLELLRLVLPLVHVPVIIAGGAGGFPHLEEAFLAGANAAACGSLFNFGDNNPLRAKAYLKNRGIPLKRV